MAIRSCALVAYVVLLAGLTSRETLAQTRGEACPAWIAKAGYSADYIKLRTGQRQPGFGSSWRGNIEPGEVQPGDVVIFVRSRNHTAIVEQVERGTDGKPARLLIASYNRPGHWIDEPCSVTEWFGIEGKWWTDINVIAKYWRPGKPL